MAQDLVAWLKKDSSIKCVLMEVGVQSGGVETTRYFSNKGYVTSPTDTPANTLYAPLIAGGVKFTESMSLDGSISLSSGDIELYNTSGNKDAWLKDVWANRTVKMYIGDVSWPRADFILIFDGIVASIDTRRRDRLNLKLTDKLQRLNTVVSEVKLGGTTQNKDKLIPLCFGEVHNIEPLLVDPANHEYQVHDGAIEDIIEVRDNGVPVTITKFLTTGKFRLNQAPVGTITASVQGDKPSTYANDITSIVKRLVKGFGRSDMRFTDADLDLTSLNAFAAANTQPVGLYLNDRANVIDACNRLVTSIGARLRMSRTGLLSIVKLDLPRQTAGTTVKAKDMLEQSLYISQLPAIIAGVKLGYCKNHTVQNNLQTGLPVAHISMFAEEWLTVTKTDVNTALKYRLHTEPTMQETLLLTEADANAEATRRLNLFSTQRKVLKYKGFAHLMTEQLGDSQTVVHERFNLMDSTITGQIIGVATDWLESSVELEVLV